MIKYVLSTAVEQLWRVTLQIGAGGGGWRGPGMASPEKQEMECRDYLMYLTLMRVALQLGLSLAWISDRKMISLGNKQTRRDGDFNFRKNENV